MKSVYRFHKENRKKIKGIKTAQGLYLFIEKHKFYLVKNNIIKYKPNNLQKYLVDSTRFLKYLNDNCNKCCYCKDCVCFNPLLVDEVIIKETFNTQSYYCPALGFKVNPDVEKNCNCYTECVGGVV